MKNFKRIFAIVAALIMAFACFNTISFAEKLPKEALPVSAGIGALRGQFESGVAPQTAGYALDYKYYSPVGIEDDTKYPLVIFLHGIGHGDYPGSQLDDSDMAYWASAEFQARFAESGGGFILMPRSPENYMIYWGENLIEPLRALIDDFIEKHKENIDTTRIAITGSSAGGAMVWNMLDAYPEYFSAAFPIASTEMPTEFTVKKASGTAIWIIASKLDPVVNYAMNTLPIWAMVKNNNDHPENCRLSSFSEVYNPDGQSSSDNHHLAGVITYDLHTHGEGVYPGVETVDGLGNTVDLTSPNGLISWLSAIHSDFDGVTQSEPAGLIETILAKVKAVFSNIFLFIVHIFQEILGL